MAEKPKPQVRVVRCDVCGHTEACGEEEVLKYRRDGWPLCCKKAMTLTITTETYPSAAESTGLYIPRDKRKPKATDE